MQNSTSTVIALFVAAIFLFVVPLVTLTERNDNVVQENVKLIVEEFVTPTYIKSPSFSEISPVCNLS